MTKLAIAAAVVSCFALAMGRKVSSSELKFYSFEQFVRDHHLEYSASELPKRRALFENELKRVQEHNAKNLSWKEGINKYSALTKEERKHLFGRSKGVAAAHDKSKLKSAEHTLPADFKVKPLSQLPKNVDWRQKDVVSVVKDQGYCGSCWAFASTATVESHVAINTGLLFELSVQQMAMCAPNPDQCGGTGQCQGSTAELAFTYLTSSKGMYSEYQYGYASYYGQEFACTTPPGLTKPAISINGYVQLPDNDYLTLMNAVATIGPMAINVDASNWHAYESGVFNGCNQASPDVNHVVVMVGYGEDAHTGEKYWLVRNSWSAAWGEAGYIRLARFDSDEDRCGMDTTPQDGVACANQTEPVKVCGTCGAIYDSSYPLHATTL